MNENNEFKKNGFKFIDYILDFKNKSDLLLT